jgi:4-amino-4-deoxy-L-arabinose transferase-like glycosyltransferase
MVTSGDWLVPRLENSPFLDKPPLLYWLSAVSFEIFGVSDASARLPIFLSALLCLGITYAQTRRAFGKPAAQMAAVVLASSPLFFGLGQLLTMDMLLTSCTTAGMAAVWCGIRDHDRRWIYAGYAATALGVLAKGPIAAALIWLPIVLYAAVKRDFGVVRQCLQWRGLVGVAVICAPWFLLVNARVDGFLANFWWHHHVERFLNPWRHREPAWFYAPVALVGVFPWSILWLLTPKAAGAAVEEVRHHPTSAYLLLCALVPFVLFSLSSSKLIPYVLPGIPPLAALIGTVYHRILERAAPALLSRGGTLFAVAGGAALACGLLFYVWVPHWRIPILRPLLTIGGASVVAAGVLAHNQAGRARFGFALTSLLLGLTALLFFVESGRADLAKDYRALSRTARSDTPAGSTLLSIGGYRPAVDFYFGRQAEVLQKSDESRLQGIWQGTKPVTAFVPAGDVAHLQQILPGVRLIARDRHAAVIANTTDPQLREPR